MIAEAIEFQISQYLDGTLSAAERSAVEAILQADPEAQKVLADYRRINEQMVLTGGMPTINWNRLADHISASVANADDHRTAPLVAGRIGFWSTKLKIAAAVLIAGTAFMTARHYTSHPTQPVQPAPHTDVTVVGPSAEFATGAPVTDITVAPSAVAARNQAAQFGYGNVVTRPSKVTISRVTPSPKNDSH